MADKFGFNKKIALLQAMKFDLPQQLAKSGERFFQQEFQRSEWDGVAWKPRKVETKRTNGKHLLVSSGRLKQAYQNTIQITTWDKIKWGVDRSIVYAAVHNWGLRAGRGKGFIMPKRQAMGDSRKLRALFTKKINFQYGEALKAR